VHHVNLQCGEKWTNFELQYFTAVFSFLQTQSFKRLPPLDVLAPINQKYNMTELLSRLFETPLLIPMSLQAYCDWLVFIRVIIGVLIDGSKNIELCSVPLSSQKMENRSNDVFHDCRSLFYIFNFLSKKGNRHCHA